MPSIAWGPISFLAGVQQVSPTSPSGAIATTDTFIEGTVDCAALAAGITREAEVQYRRSSAGSRDATGNNDGNSAVITSADAAFVAGDVGKFVRGGGIPDGTTISSVDSPTQVTVSKLIGLGGQGYVLTIGDPWVSLGIARGTTVGGPDLTKQGAVTEWGVRATLPDPGVAGRQVRAAVKFGSNVTVSGHATSG